VAPNRLGCSTIVCRARWNFRLYSQPSLSPFDPPFPHSIPLHPSDGKLKQQEKGRKVLDSFLAKVATAGTVERAPMMDGKKMTALIMPNKSMAKPKPKPDE
jgi:hypothetical protein